MTDNQNPQTPGTGGVEELLWEVCLKARSFLDVLESLKLDLGESTDEKEELVAAFVPLMKERKFQRHIAKLHLDRHQWLQAQEAYDRLGEESDEVIWALGEIHMHLKHFEKADAYFSRLLAADENNPVAWFKKALVHYQSGTDLEDSVFYLERALELDPNNIDALVLMSKTWIDRAKKKTDAYIKNRMQKESLKCLDSAETQIVALASPMKEFNLARISALRAKTDPANEEKHLEKLTVYLQDAMEQDASGRLMIKEMVNNEKAFADLGIEFVEVQEEGKAPEPDPPAQEEAVVEEEPEPVVEAKKPAKPVSKDKPKPKKAQLEPEGEEEEEDDSDVPTKSHMLAPDDIYS